MEGFVVQAAELGVLLTNDQRDKFERYQSLLIEWNQRMNLTAIRTPAEIQTRHFLDSISCASVMGDLNGAKVIDVGSGAGFPGLPLKILYPGMQLTLVESTVKKTRFLEEVINDLQLALVHVLAERAESLGQTAEHRAKYDWATARGVAELRILVEYLLPLCRIGGSMLAQKGSDAVQEIPAASTAIETLGGSDAVVHPIQLPAQPMTHHLVTIEKTRETPARYPRRVGIPNKRPL